MAPAKKRGAPASAAGERQWKPSKRIGKQKTKAEKLAVCVAKDRAAFKELKNQLSARAKEYAQQPYTEEVVTRVEQAIKRQVGRPTMYTEAMGKRMSDLLVAGISVMEICEADGMPGEVTVFRWIGDPKHPFSMLYKNAKQLMVARFEEENQRIADEPQIGEIITTRESINPVTGELQTTTEVKKYDMLEHRKLRIATRQWTLSHLMPKKHGHHAQPGGDAPNEQLNALFAALNAGPKE